MKRLHKRFLLATFCALFTATLQAVDVTITVNGRVVAKPCTIQTKEANVNLGDLYTRNLQQPGSASGWHNITLSLTDCPVETSAVTAIVTGSTDNTGYYKNEGTAENIQIELRDDQDATLKNGDSKTVIVDEITRNAQFPLKARAITVNGNASQGTIEALINVIYTGNNVDSIFLAFFLNQFLTLGYIMGKTISIKVLFGIYLLLMAGKVFAFSCNVDGGSSIGAGTTSVYVNLDPVIQPGQNLVVDLSQHISCWNDYGGWYDTDHINLVQGSAFAGSLQSYKGSLYWNNVTYPFPLTTNTNVLDIGDKTPMPLPLKLYITPVGAAGGVVIKAGEVIARIHMYKIATLGSGNPRNFTWNIISNNNVVMPTGGCTVDSRNVTVDLPDFPGSAEIPLGVYCSSEQKLSFYLSGATTDSARQVFANTAPDATKASGVGVSLMRNGKILATGENVSLGTVNKSKVPLGLSATYGQTGNKVSAGTVQSVIGVTFIYE